MEKNKTIKIPGVTVIAITGEYIRLDQFLKFAGIAETGGMAKEIIAAGGVRVNGEVVTERGRKLRGGMIVRAGGGVFVVDNG